eukprot:5598387-Prorocentrum_lima.AAC.1
MHCRISILSPAKCKGSPAALKEARWMLGKSTCAASARHADGLLFSSYLATMVGRSVLISVAALSSQLMSSMSLFQRAMTCAST